MAEKSVRAEAEYGTVHKCDWCDEPAIYLMDEGRARRAPACEAHAAEWFGCDADRTPIMAIEVFFFPECQFPKTGRVLTFANIREFALVSAIHAPILVSALDAYIQRVR